MIITFLKGIWPLYATIAFAFFCGKLFTIPKKFFARTVFFILTPLIIFDAASARPLELNLCILPFGVFCICVFSCFATYVAARVCGFAMNMSRLMAMSSGTGNSGYFGIPALMLLWPQVPVAEFIFAMLGMTLSENTLGVYMIGRNQFSPKAMAYKLATLPALWALCAGIAWNEHAQSYPQLHDFFSGPIRSIYISFGMLLIGFNLSKSTLKHIDWRFTFACIGFRMGFWLMALFLLHHLDIFTFASDYLFVMALVPLAVNSVILASLFETEEEKMATAVCISTILASIYMPLAVQLMKI